MRFDTASGRCALSTPSALSTTAWLMPLCRGWTGCCGRSPPDCGEYSTDHNGLSAWIGQPKDSQPGAILLENVSTDYNWAIIVGFSTHEIEPGGADA